MCKNGLRYKGYTSNFKGRMLAHFNGFGSPTTAWMGPEYILHYEVYDTKSEAMNRERFFKSSEGFNWLRNNESSFNTIKP
jgi:putative endonuclease